MPTKQQVSKNLKLTEKLLDYLAKNPGDSSSNISYVMFSKDDEALNKANLKLVDSLLKEGKRVVKAEESNDKKLPWKFTQVAA